MVLHTGVSSVFFVFILIGLQLFCDGNDRHYTNSWAVHLPNLDHEKVHEIARRHGMINLGQVGTLEGYYHFIHRAYPKRMRRETIAHTSKLSREFKVKWVEQQAVKKRVKRDSMPGLYPDPLWKNQWYLHNDQELWENYDHNVVSVWQKLNITGRGVSVSILDDGIEKNHPDLKENYDPDASFDYNDNDPDPSPRATWNDENRHGTRCAGEVAAVAGNNYCGIGVAYGAKVGGIRMLDGDVTDVVEAHSLSFKPEHIDIYSSSWGPDDDGKTVDGPGSLARAAFSQGIAKGRGGLGNIFVWASGNGGRDQDNCNCDGYTNNIYTLSISSATEHGTSPWYSEYCASTLASTFSSGSYGQRKIVTTDLHNRCTQDHTGTSASAPLAAGILALALEANPKLTWRDMQHIVVRTSKPDKLKSNDWVTNAVGRKISHRFGYGLLDAKALVDLAIRWKTSPEKHACSEPKDTKVWTIPNVGSLTVEKDTTGCKGTENYIRYLEHVEVIISLSFPRRGDLAIYIISPQGTRSTLLAKRRMDYSSSGFKDWAFMTTHAWEENPKGKWKLEIQNVGSNTNTGSLTSWQLRFHGTQEAPGVFYANCSSECKGGCHGPTGRDCSQCANFKSNGVCVSECQEREYADKTAKECKPCSSDCEKCQGPTASDCTTCKTSMLLMNGSCVASCPNGWFENQNKGCEQCDLQCVTCSNDAKTCTSCKEDHKLEYDRCVIDCKKSEYASKDQCWPCHPSCLTCHNGTAWSCAECGIAAVTREGVKEDLYLHYGMCVATCPHGFYGNNHKCVLCDTSCKHCKGPLKTDCTSCKDGLVRMSNDSGLCLDNCPLGSSHMISEDTCVQCGSDCSACEPDQPTNCTDCRVGMFLWQRQCVRADACPRGTYPEKESRRCRHCHPSCDTCSDQPTNCTSCTGYSYLYGGQCKLVCPVGTYGNKNRCLPCHGSCSSCFGEAQHECLTCEKNLYFFNNSCVKQCPQGMFGDNRERCQLCSLTCQGGCEGEATNCSTCKDGFKKINGVCKSLCESGTVQNSTLAVRDIGNGEQNHCSSCHESCSTCFGPSKHDCLRCTGVKFRDPKSKLCLLECTAAGHYQDLSSTLCKPCPSECSRCTNEDTCVKCIPRLLLHEKKCIPYCPEGYYAEDATKSCLPCDDNCKACAGTATTCTKCITTRILYENTCITKCPDGNYFSKDFNRCMPCDVSCANCVGAGRRQCTSCKPGLVLFLTQCRFSCPAQYYFSAEGEKCQPCGYYCRKCSGGNGLSSCTECLPPLVLENNQCVRTCSPGFVLDRAKRECVACHESCATCMGTTADQCLSCKDKSESLEGSVCKKSCDAGTYRNPETSACVNCHPVCKTCSKGGEGGCTSCRNGHSFSLSKCLSACAVGQYKHKGDCYTCSSGCKTCNGATSKECLSCNDNKKLFNFTCVKNCPPGTYASDFNGLQECGLCHPSCVTCSRAGADACTSCRMDLYLQGTNCVRQCSINHRLDENTKTCKRCNADCPTYANITDRSILSHNSDNTLSNKVEYHFILIAVATCLSVLALFAVLGLFRNRSSSGYTKVESGSSLSAGTPLFSLDNGAPGVSIRDESTERDPMLADHDNVL